MYEYFLSQFASAEGKKGGQFYARKLGTMTDRVHQELTDENIQQIAVTYHAWRGDSAGATRDPPLSAVLLKAAFAHVQLETIHPFLDGNGRDDPS